MDSNHRRILQDNLNTLVEHTKNDINNIVNEFRQRSVINDFMVNKINKHSSDEEKARQLWLMLPKRGPDAYRKIQDVVATTGNGELLKFIRRPTHFMLGNKAIEVPNNGLIDEREVVVCEELSVYPMKTMPRGYVLIVNVYSDLKAKNYNREGSEVDVTNLKELYERLGHVVKIISQPTKKLFTDGIRQFLTAERLEANCCTVFIMSHGNGDDQDPEVTNISFYDNETVSTKWILEQMRASEAPPFNGRPKIVFFVSCRGKLHDLGVRIQRDLQIITQPQTDGVVQRWPLLSDLLVVHSTLQGYVSYRDENGSWLIQELVDVMSRRAGDTDLITMLEEVSRRVLERGSSTSVFQITPVNTYGFNKKLYFNPPPSFFKNPTNGKT